MSKTISLIGGGASAALMQAAASIVAKATGGAVKTAPAAKASAAAAVVVGQAAPQGVYACVARPPAAPEAAYAGVKTTVVRAVLPRAAADKVQLRDALDVYTASGIDSAAENEAAAAAFTKAATLAARLAKEELKSNRVTLLIKPATKFERLNDAFVKAATKAIEAEGCTVDVSHTGRATNELLMFPEKYGVILTNDDPICENVQYAWGSAVGGGVPLTYHTEAGGKISGGHSYKTVALALAQELRGMGMAAEAAKIEAAAQKDPRNIANAI